MRLRVLNRMRLCPCKYKVKDRARVRTLSMKTGTQWTRVQKANELVRLTKQTNNLKPDLKRPVQEQKKAQRIQGKFSMATKADHKKEKKLKD